MRQQLKAFHTLILHFQVGRNEKITESSYKVTLVELLVKLSPRKGFSLTYGNLEKVKCLPPDFLIVVFQIPKKELFESRVDLNI